MNESNQDKVPTKDKHAMGSGFFSSVAPADSLSQLLYPIYNIYLGVNPAVIGIITAALNVWDGITDPLVASISDNLRTKYGRRKPVIFIGIFLTALAFTLIWSFPVGREPSFYVVYLIGSLLVFKTAHTIFCVPMGALSLELTSGYQERTVVQNYRSFYGAIAGIFGGWALAASEISIFDNALHGVRWVSIAIGFLIIVTGLVPILFLREKHQGLIQKQNKVSLLTSMRETVSNRNYVILILAWMISYGGLGTVGGLGLYVNVYYIYGGNIKDASLMMGFSNMTWQLSSFTALAIIPLASVKLGKKKSLYYFAVISVIGTLTSWFFYNPTYPYLQLISIYMLSFGFSCVNVQIPSMISDLCDIDELETRERREGMFWAFFTFITKTGGAISALIAGVSLVMIGFDEKLGANQSDFTITTMRLLFTIVPALGLMTALSLIFFYPVTEKQMKEVRAKLEARRGKF